MMHPLSKPEPTLVCLHGFLGLPEDWNDILQDEFARYKLIDLYDRQFPSPSEGMWKWAKTFNSVIKKQSNPSNILVGYSLGGRLGLHALVENPSLWKKAIIISANPGMPNNSPERILRQKQDQIWADKFLSQNWDSLIDEWNSQPIFNGHRFERVPERFNRKQLAMSLVNWSLSSQEDLQEQLDTLTIPLLWIAGEKDQRYSSLFSTLKLTHPKSKCILIPNSGHRVPWEQKTRFIKEVKDFIYDNHDS